MTGVLVQPYHGRRNPNSPARRAGIEPGDVIVKADGKLADRVSTLQRIIRSHEPGETVQVEAWRYGSKKTFNVRLGEANDSTTRVASNTRPRRTVPSRRAQHHTEKLGITVEPISDAQAQQNRIADEYRGLRVVDIDPNGPARQGRLLPNDILVSVVNPQPRRNLRTTQDLQQALSGEGRRLPEPDGVQPGAGQTRIVNMRVGHSRRGRRQEAGND